MQLDNNMDFVALFESKLSDYTGFKYAVATDCCTNALLLCCEAKARFNIINKNKLLTVPKQTYMSVPMTLMNNGWQIKFIDDYWKGKYMFGHSTEIFDAATDMHEDMYSEYKKHDIPLVCISFQQKKRLPLGRGGAILLNDKKIYKLLKRIVYDGRNPYISDNIEVEKHSKDIVLGYHCYMEPDKAAKGILLLNQIDTLRPYSLHSYVEYPDISSLKIWQ